MRNWGLHITPPVVGNGKQNIGKETQILKQVKGKGRTCKWFELGLELQQRGRKDGTTMNPFKDGGNKKKSKRFKPKSEY